VKPRLRSNKGFLTAVGLLVVSVTETTVGELVTVAGAIGVEVGFRIGDGVLLLDGSSVGVDAGAAASCVTTMVGEAVKVDVGSYRIGTNAEVGSSVCCILSMSKEVGSPVDSSCVVEIGTSARASKPTAVSPIAAEVDPISFFKISSNICPF
jgi:hypothetical protein